MTKTEKVPILGIFSPNTIFMFRVGLKIRVGRPTGTTHTFHLSLTLMKFSISSGSPLFAKVLFFASQIQRDNIYKNTQLKIKHLIKKFDIQINICNAHRMKREWVTYLAVQKIVKVLQQHSLVIS